jgi:two-component system LytT family response regulator
MKLSQPHALIIDDDSNNIQVLANMLSKEGVTHTGILDPVYVENFLQAADRIDIVFLDLEMADCSGYDILQLLKTDARFHPVPVCAYTVHISEINAAFEAGFDSFLAKPLDSERFPEQLARILCGEQVWERA